MIKALFLILFCANAFAAGPMIIGGSSGPTNCPSYFEEAILSMDFENGLNACDSSGNNVLFTDDSSDIGAYGETGQGMKVDADGEFIYLTQTDSQYVNEDADQTLCLKINVSAQLDNDTALARFHDAEFDDQIQMHLSLSVYLFFN